MPTTDELIIAVPPAVALAGISLLAWYLKKRSSRAGDNHSD